MTKRWRMVPNNTMRKRGREGCLRAHEAAALAGSTGRTDLTALLHINKCWKRTAQQSRAECNRTRPPDGKIRRNLYVGVVAGNSAAALSQRMFTRSPFEELPGCIIRPMCSHSSLQWQWLQGGWSTHQHPIRRLRGWGGNICLRRKRQSWTCTRCRAWLYHTLALYITTLYTLA